MIPKKNCLTEIPQHKISWQTKKKMGGRRPEGRNTGHRNTWMVETAGVREEWRRLLKEARSQKGL